MIVDEAQAVVDRITPTLRELVAAELAQLRAAAPRPVPKAEREIMEACRKVALASDALAQAKFSGCGEVPARMALARAADSLARVMHKHGRMP